MTSDFRHDENEICALLAFYAVQNPERVQITWMTF